MYRVLPDLYAHLVYHLEVLNFLLKHSLESCTKCHVLAFVLGMQLQKNLDSEQLNLETSFLNLTPRAWLELRFSSVMVNSSTYCFPVLQQRCNIRTKGLKCLQHSVLSPVNVPAAFHDVLVCF